MRNAEYRVRRVCCGWPPQPAAAQTPAADTQLVPPPSWAFNDIACAPTLDMDKAPDREAARHSASSGSRMARTANCWRPGALLVVSGGSNAGLEPGQRYFVRRAGRALADDRLSGNTGSVHTAGWMQILGVDTTLATADDHARLRRHPARRLSRAIHCAHDRRAAASGHGRHSTRTWATSSPASTERTPAASGR